MKEKENLIVITADKAGFEYDIHALVKAFYPACEVKVFVEENTRASSDLGLPDIDIKFTREAVLLSFIEEEGGRASFGAHKIEIGENMTRPEIKNRLKQLLYTVLSEHTGIQLPWGTLTGIRPVKIPMTMLTEGRSDRDIMEYMKKTYFISDEKGGLALEIAKGKKACLKAFTMRKVTVCTWGFPSALPHVCTVPLPLIPLPHGKNG